jgi:hypothetical protein
MHLECLSSVRAVFIGRTEEVIKCSPYHHPVPRGYKYGNLALQVGGVSDETVKYGFGF